MRRAMQIVVVAVGLFVLANPAAALIDLLSVNQTEEESEVVVCKIPFFTLFETRSTKAGERETTLVDVPFITLYEHEQTEEKTSWEVLEVPFIELLEVECEGDNRCEVEFLSLPFIGSLYGYERDGEERRQEILFFIPTSTK